MYLVIRAIFIPLDPADSEKGNSSVVVQSMKGEQIMDRHVFPLSTSMSQVFSIINEDQEADFYHSASVVG